jgi:type IV secretory pathway protease TraF
VGRAHKHDRLGRTLPGWEGCRLIVDHEAFLMNWQSEHSLDGRYFGPLSASTVVGRAHPLWTDEGR